jgi:hypothetical protein
LPLLNEECELDELECLEELEWLDELELLRLMLDLPEEYPASSGAQIASSIAALIHHDRLLPTAAALWRNGRPLTKYKNAATS